MAQLINVRLNRVDAQPWGLRLQGGKDFGTPLVVQKVNHGSIADQAGLQPGDAVIAVNNMEAFNLRHKDAQDLIVRSGNTFDLTIQRGGSTWKPHVSPTGSMPSPGQQNYGGPVTKTSLQHHPPPQEPHIGCGYNNSARPFSQNGSVKSIVNKQYNTPVGMYSEESIAETLTAQAEVLANGVLGVNFKKNEKAYNSEGSEVLKALKESENDPPEPASSHFYWTASHAIGNYSAVSSRTNTPNPYSAQQQQFQQQQQQQPSPQPICRKEDFAASETVQRPILPSTTIDTTKTPTVQTKIVDSSTQCIVADTTSSRASPPCDACGATIVGVFVRIKDKNLHVDCFKCATCGTSLKNQGYFNINNKLYCDVHAKLAAVQNPPTGTEGYRPGLIQPNSKLNANSTISNALSSHANGGHDFTIMPTHSRTSSSASSVGSSYVSSTDSNKTSHIESPTPIQSQLLENVNNSNNFHTLNGTQTLPSYQNAYKLINEHLHNHKNGNSNGNGNGNINGNGHSNNNEQEYHDDCSDNDQIDFNDLHHESSITCNKLSMIDQTVNETNGKSNDSIYGTIKQFNNEQMIGGEHFAYKTLNGDVIRSVQPPGKGKPINYKIKSNLGGPRPFGVPTAGPRSPAMNQSWSQPIPAQTSFVNNYGSQTLPRSTVGQNAPAKTNPIQYQQQQHHHHQHQTHGHHQVNNQQHYDNDHSNSVVFRNKNTKPELTTHARDRRSYIEKDNFNQNRYLNHNNNLITSQATEIATGLKDGKHPVCSVCHIKITRGPFITALGRIWCPEHFVCVNGSCRRPLQDIGFVEEKGDLYCEYCFEQFLAPPCDKCSGKIKGDCLNAIGKHFHPECFTCTYCGKLFGNSPFFLEDGRPYCESDWNELFTTKCFACGFPVEAGDRWVEALSHNYHSQCFNCTMCKKNLEGQSFYAKAGRPYCKNHAR
ncbi:PDZ and LIM domain protein Zasp isoform X5 [Contarinia nasturtii]|uniref:PDZ and LIM domain protein Zasp isoform X5 n=1 Tax=Contarinia nasturtii TaxID=265458 RepID=UPI0012D37E91|nr:PDZ and LIM domain protein Zasp isoform X5 [Contarinia nasturtii]